MVRFLSRGGQIFFLTLTILVVGGCLRTTRFGRVSYAAALENSALRAINQEREKHHLPPLKNNATLRRIARNHTRFMVENNLFEHRGNRGTLVEGRLDRYKIDWVDAGENIARNKGFTDPVGEAVRGWLASPDHRKNIMSKKYQETGMGIARSKQTGYYYFTQVFLRQMPK